MTGPNLIISAAVSVLPFVGTDGKPLTDVSEFSVVLNYIGSYFVATNFNCGSLMSHLRTYEL